MSNVLVETCEINKIVTHPGLFHADDVSAAAYMMLQRCSALVTRAVPTELDLLDPHTLVLDIGGDYNTKLLNFDHHQSRDIKQSSFGLVVDAFPLKNKEVHDRFVDMLVRAIDAADLGLAPGLPADAPFLSLSKAISYMNPVDPSASTKDRDNAFNAAKSVMGRIISAAIKSAEAWVSAKTKVLEAATELDGSVLVLEEFCAWQEHVFSRPDQEAILYVIFPSLRGGWQVQQMPVEPDSFQGRKPLPEAWGGLRGEALAKVTGLPLGDDPSVFCHAGRFIGGAATKEDVLAMARLAIEA